MASSAIAMPTKNTPKFSKKALGSHELSGVTGMIMTVRVADSGLRGTVPKAKRLLARRRRRKF